MTSILGRAEELTLQSQMGRGVGERHEAEASEIWWLFLSITFGGKQIEKLSVCSLGVGSGLPEEQVLSARRVSRSSSLLNQVNGPLPGGETRLL